MPAVLQIKVQDNLFVRDPAETDLGRRIVSDGILLMDELGFDAFTFKKLATKISSTEASVYRYFESKHQFLQYLVSWYWNWLDFIIDYRIHNIEDPHERLKCCIEAIAESDKYDPMISHINESALHKIIIAESARVYMTKQTGKEKRKNLFEDYGLLVQRISAIIKEIRPRYKFAETLAMTLIISIHRQMFHQDFMESRSSGKKSSKKSSAKDRKDRSAILEFSQQLVTKMLDS
jgi:AcrR family transcriptional regulator